MFKGQPDGKRVVTDTDEREQDAYGAKRLPNFEMNWPQLPLKKLDGVDGNVAVRGAVND